MRCVMIFKLEKITRWVLPGNGDVPLGLTDYHQFTTRMIKSINVFRSMDRVCLFSQLGLTVHAIDRISFSIEFIYEGLNGV